MAASRKLYVNADTGSGSASGASETRARDTIAGALALAVSGRGDTIYIAPGSYTENLIITKDYVRLVALYPGGYARPDVVPAAGIACIVRAQGVVLDGIRFASADNDALKIEGNGGRLLDCVLDGAGTSNKAGLRLQPNATDNSMTASEWQIGAPDQRNLFRGNAYAIIFDTAAAPVGVGSTHNRIAHNDFVQNTIDLGTKDSGAGTYSLQYTIVGPGNVFLDKNKTAYVDLTTANGGSAGDQSGVIAGNFFNTDAFTTTNVKMVGTAFGFAGNSSNLGVGDETGLD